MDASDKAALERVRRGTEGGTFPIIECGERRFLCEKYGRVIQMLLNTMGLEGRIVPEIRNLTKLKILALFGRIPNSIGQLKDLQELRIYGNQFTGAIPSSIGQLKSLREIDISYNALSGKIPDSIGRLKSLKYLYLNGNQLSGNVPKSIGLITSLLHVQLTFNSLSGDTPETIVQMKSIQVFDISHNYFAGPIIKGRGHPNCKKLRSNCLFNSSLPSRCTSKGQRSKCECTAFCDATQLGGSCGGFGVCSIGKDKKHAHGHATRATTTLKVNTLA